MLNGTKTAIKHKIGLLNLAEELGSVSKACRIMGFYRDTFYRYQNAVEQGGIDALVDQNRRKPNIRNRVGETTEDMARSVPATNCVSAGCSFPRAGFGVYGCVTIQGKMWSGRTLMETLEDDKLFWGEKKVA